MRILGNIALKWGGGGGGEGGGAGESHSVSLTEPVEPIHVYTYLLFTSFAEDVPSVISVLSSSNTFWEAVVFFFCGQSTVLRPSVHMLPGMHWVVRRRSSAIPHSLLVVDSSCGHNWCLCFCQMGQFWRRKQC